MSRRPIRVLLAAAATAVLALVQLVAVSAGAHAATTPSLSFTPAAVYSRSDGASPTHWYNRPNLAAARVQENGTTVVRLFRTVNAASADSSDVNDDNFENQWSDVGKDDWHTMNYDQKSTRAANINFVQDGNTLYSFDEIALGYTGADSTQYAAVRRISTDGGQTWTTDYGTVNMPIGSTPWQPSSDRIYLYQGITVVGSQWIMPVYYGQQWSGTSPKTQAGLIVSTNQGKTWQRVAAPFQSSLNWYSESTVAVAPDQHLIMVSRLGAPGTANYLGELLFSRSDDVVDASHPLATGEHFTTQSSAVVAGAPTRDTHTLGSSPKLVPIAGRLLLAFGRPGNMLAVSPGGASDDGTTYSGLTTIHANQPSVDQYPCHDGLDHKSGPLNSKGDATYNVQFCQALGSSGYMGVAVVTDNSSGHWGYVIGDRCHVWSCERAKDADNPDGGDWPDVKWTPGYTQQAVWLDRFDVSG